MIIDEFIKKEKNNIKNYLDSFQLKDFRYSNMYPDPYLSLYCIKVLKLINSNKSLENTKDWLLSRNVANRGFGETTGQNAWHYTSYNATEMIYDLNISHNSFPAIINNIKKLYLNKDGGFSANGQNFSNYEATVYWCNCIINLNGKIDLNTIKYLLENLKLYKKCDIFFVYLGIRVINYFGLHTNLIEEIINYYNKIHSNLNGYLNIYKINKLIGKNNKHIIKKINCHNLKYFNSVYETYILCEIFHENIKNRGKIEKYILNFMTPYGGFHSRKITNILTSYECIATLKSIKKNPKNKKNIEEKIKNQLSKVNMFSIDIKFTFWFLKSLSLLLCKKKISPSKDLISYLLLNNKLNKLYGLFYILNILKLLNINIINIYDLLIIIEKHQNKDGGFSDSINGFSEMYATYRAIDSINNLVKTDFKNIKFNCYKNKIKKIFEKAHKWIKKCENKSGFSWKPNEDSFIQPTYQALHCLRILNKKIHNLENHKKFIFQCYNQKGEFNGGVMNSPPSSIYAYYSIMSLLILKEQEENQKNKELDSYLGL